MEYKTTSHKYKLFFMGITTYQHIDVLEIPINHFAFVPFARINNSRTENIIVGNYKI